jgi:hypothetical protein
MKRHLRAVKSVATSGLLALLLCPLSSAAQSGPGQPFYPGETLVFNFYWSIIPTGSGSLKVLPVENLGGVQSYHFQMTTRTNAFADLFYKVRDRFDTWTDTAMTRTLLYRKKQREGSTRRDVEVIFDWRRKEARYFKSGRLRRTTPLQPGTFDPVSAFFWVRHRPLKAGKTVTRPISDGKKVFTGRVRVARREKIRLAGKTYDTFVLVPELTHAGGVFEKSPGARIRIWVTTDHRRLPVMIKSKVIVGSFRAELVEAESVIPGP